MPRFDTLGNHGSFSLRHCDYGHNGGLNAAVPGPSFVVNTENGTIYVAAHRSLSGGKHHLAGTYDGQTARLYIDGKLTAQCQGNGRIASCDEPVVLGQFEDGLGRFDGEIVKAEVHDIARTDTEIAAMACE